MNVTTILRAADKLLKKELIAELNRQGHRLSGALEQSIEGVVERTSDGERLKGFARYYQKFLNQGVPADRISWKMFPFIVRYFQARGLDAKEAKRAAAGTIRKWMIEGMPTRASVRFSSTGKRTGFIGAVDRAVGGPVRNMVNRDLKKLVISRIRKTKTEVV